MKQFFLVLFFYLLSNIAFGNAWEQKANFGSTGRHRGTAFAIKDKGYMGLGHINSVVNIAYADIWEYDPASDTWTQKADFGGGDRYHAVAFTVGEKAYCGSGRKPSNSWSDDFWEFDPVANSWTQISDIPGGMRLGALAFVIDTLAYVGAGSSSTGTSEQYYSYYPPTDTWTPIADFPGNDRATGVAFAINGKGYVGTGSAGFGAGNDFWEYKPEQDQWIQRANVGPTPRQGATGFAINGKGYILTGNNFGNGLNYRDVWEYEPATDVWKQIDDFPGAKRRFMNSFVIGNTAYCGIGTNGTNFNDFWSFTGTVSLEEEWKSGIKLYPNPTSGLFKIVGLSGFQGEIIVYNLSGQPVLEQRILATNVIDASELKKGIYLYALLEGTQCIKSGKIQIQ
ncbi:MAG: kelch repeat-containing protein [Lishizhenia sp.]